MTSLIAEIVAKWQNTAALLLLKGPFLSDESPADISDNYALFSIAEGKSKTYMTPETDKGSSASVTFSLYSTQSFKLDNAKAALDLLFDKTGFPLSDGYCEGARRVSATKRNAGQNENRELLYELTYVATFDFHTIPSVTPTPDP